MGARVGPYYVQKDGNGWSILLKRGKSIVFCGWVKSHEQALKMCEQLNAKK